ncbi:MAG: PQQ-like beta-propeller repeat protein, partial [Planctomycetes bacterium]|nr:PQQ-like beta-propeller repeat protein [Planctomycetota bacterium]
MCCWGPALDPGDADAPPRPPLDRSPADVYLNDSFQAADAIAAARRLAKRGRWSEAAELLGRTADTLGDKLVQVDVGYYVGISRHVADVLSAWPAEGLRVYRTLYDGAMEQALRGQSATRTADALLGLFDRYFCTSAAAQLADRIGQLAIESGDVALAQRVYTRALERHPDRDAHAAQWEAMLAVVRAMRGHRDADPSAVDMDAKVRWMGEQRTLRAVLDAIDRSFARLSAEAPESPSDWPIFGGRSDRGRIGSSRVDELGLLWRFHFASSRTTPGTNENFELVMSDTDTTTRASVHPVVSGDGIIIQRLRDVVTLHRNTGAQVWRFGAGDGGGATHDDFEERPLGWGSATIHERRVYAALPGEVDPYYGFESVRSTTELVCLDLATGRTIWRSSRDRLGESFNELHFDSSPIVSRGRVYLAGRRRRSFGFEDCYLYAFNAADGTLQFKTHLGSASTGTFGSRQATTGIPSLLGDTVYVCTSLGSVAAVSAHTGVVRWLRLYEREVGGRGSHSSWSSRRIQPWEFNPVLLSNDRVICLPNDTKNLLVLAEEDGRLLQSIPRDSLGGLRTLLGLRGDLLCGSGDQIACYDLLNGSVRWVASLPDKQEVRGRGAWVDDRLLIPSEQGLHIFELADGARTDLSWDVDGEPGNILALSDRLIVAGAHSISAYVRKEEIWTALRDRMAAAPSDPAPALDLAEVAFGSGEVAQALDALAEAVRRAGGFAAAMEPELTARVFADALSFAEKLAARSVLEPDMLDTLFSYASQYPPGRAEHVRYRLSFGTFFEKLARPERAMQLYQQILRDRSLREFSAEPTGASVESAGRRARARIARLIEQHGRDIYAPHETEAANRLEAARDARNETMLARVVEAFPNAQAAPLALIAHGSLLSELDRPTEAAGRFAAAYHRYPKQVDRPTLLRLIADAYDQAGKLEHAYRWLTKAAREHPSAMIESKGRRMSFLEYRKRLDHVRKKVEPSRPSIVLPLDHHFTRELEESALLLTPRFHSEAACDWSRYYVRTPAGIRAFHAGTGAELWPGDS